MRIHRGIFLNLLSGDSTVCGRQIQFKYNRIFSPISSFSLACRCLLCSLYFSSLSLSHHNPFLLSLSHLSDRSISAVIGLRFSGFDTELRLRVPTVVVRTGKMFQIFWFLLRMEIQLVGRVFIEKDAIFAFFFSSKFSDCMRFSV